MNAYFCKCCNEFIKQSDDFEDGIGRGEFRGEEVYEGIQIEV